MKQSLSLARHAFVGGAILPLMAANDPDDESADHRSSGNGQRAVQGEELPYRVELWNVAKTAVEQVLAITAHASIGHVAFYAAAREYPDRYLTLSHKQGIINRWNAPSH